MGGDLLVSGFLVKESMREDYEGKRLDAADAVFSDSDNEKADVQNSSVHLQTIYIHPIVATERRAVETSEPSSQTYIG